MHRRAWVLIGVLAALWGASYMFIKIALEGGFSPAGVVFLRTALAALVLMPFALRRGVLRVLRGPALGWVVVLALVQVVAPLLLISIGELHIESSLAGVLVSAAPIFTVLLALRFDAAERATGWRAVGILVGVAGVALLFGVDLTGDLEEALGGAAVLLASLGYAIGPLMSKHRLHGVPPLAIVTGSMTIAAIVLALVVPFAGVTAHGGPDGGAVAAVVVLGLAGTGLAFLIFYTVVGEVGPSRASIVAYVAPGFSVLYGALLLDEAVGPATVAGLVLILAGSYLGAEGRLPGRRRPLPAVEPVAEGASSAAP